MEIGCSLEGFYRISDNMNSVKFLQMRNDVVAGGGAVDVYCHVVVQISFGLLRQATFFVLLQKHAV